MLVVRVIQQVLEQLCDAHALTGSLVLAESRSTSRGTEHFADLVPHAGVKSTVASVTVANSSFALELSATEFPTLRKLVSLCSAFIDGASTSMDEVQSRFANE